MVGGGVNRGWAGNVLEGERGTIQADFTATTILAIGIGAILATQLPRVGIPCNPLAIAVIVAAIGALELLEAQVGGIFVQGWPWGAFLVLGGLWELRPALTRPSKSRRAA